ncbi:ABC transporter permease [Aeromicrobium marinum]|uniref:ABC transporter permease n=1 Tax=Aeromicrobium marinum TaxID=219314 RepID=UPI0001BCCC95|nr:ABC transporter permease [Aeromicrobium marinum]
MERTTPGTTELVDPGRGAGLVDVVRRRYLLSLLIRKDVQVRYRGSVLGWAWSFVKPAAQFTVFYFALGVFLRLNQSIENYPIYLFSGLILINFFSEAFSNATKALVDNGALIKKIYLPRELFPVSMIVVALVNFLPQMLILLGVCLFNGWDPSVGQVAGLFLAGLIIMIFALGLGMLFGAANVSFRDSQNFVELIVMVAPWASPVLYQWSMVRDVVPQWLFTLYQLNPITSAVNLMHSGFWEPTTGEASTAAPDTALFAAIGLTTSLLVLATGQYVFRRLEGRFAQDL